MTVYINGVAAAGITKLSELTIDVSKDWAAKKIENLAAPVAVNDAVRADANLRAPDSTLLEGSTKAQVQDHTPKAHTLASHSTKAHNELTEVGVSDHHVKYTNAQAVAAAEAAGLALASGKNIKLIANLIADQTWSGLTAVLQAGEEITITELVYVKNDGKVWLAKSDAAGTMPAIAMATATVDADAWGEFLLLGFFREDTILDFTLGDMLYVSDTVAGAFDNVLPDGGDQVQVIGKCIVGVHIVFFNPSLELVETS